MAGGIDKASLMFVYQFSGIPIDTGDLETACTLVSFRGSRVASSFFLLHKPCLRIVRGMVTTRE